MPRRYHGAVARMICALRATTYLWEATLVLMVWYLVFMVLGDVAAYFIGLAVEYEWGSQVSLVVFLVLYFASLWSAYLLAVWVTKPRTVPKPA